MKTITLLLVIGLLSLVTLHDANAKLPVYSKRDSKSVNALAIGILTRDRLGLRLRVPDTASNIVRKNRIQTTNGGMVVPQNIKGFIFNHNLPRKIR